MPRSGSTWISGRDAKDGIVQNDAPVTGDLRTFAHGVDAIDFLISAFELEGPRSGELSNSALAMHQEIAGTVAAPNPMP